MAKVLGKDPFSYQKESDSFLQDLKQFHRSRGTLFRQIPRLCGKEVDLFLLYTKVTALGGWEKVNDEQKWDSILEYFHVPKETTNGAQALKQIYFRHLDLYEKVNHFGEDPDRRDDDDEEGLPAHRRKTTKYMTKVPMFYNYRQHNVTDQARTSNGLSMHFAPCSKYDNLEKSLLSGLPNEVDFAINVCTLLSNEGRHVLKLDQSHRLIELLMAQVGIYSDGPGSYIKFHEEWRKLTGRNFVRFWCDSVRDKQAQDLVSPSAAIHLQDAVASSKTPDDDLETTYELDTKVNEHIFNFGRELGISDEEGQRIMQVASIIRNLSFEEENQMALASNLLIFRFLLLSTYSKYSCLKQIGLDTLGNISIQMVLEPIDCWTTQLIMKTICRCLASHDKFDVIRGMEILSKLCRVDENEDLIAEYLDGKAYEDIINMLSILDIQLIVHALEVLYQLSELGEITTTHIAAVKSSVDMLVQLVTIEAQSYGQNALFGVKVVEHAPSPMQQQQLQQQQRQASNTSHQAPPSQPPFTGHRSLPPALRPVHAVSHGPPPPPQIQHQPPKDKHDAESEMFASKWLNAHFESVPGFRIGRTELYNAYLASCNRNQPSGVVSTMDFTKCLRMVFPDVECYKVDKPNGTSDIQFRGIRRRPVPRPFPLPGEMMGQRGPMIINRPHLAPSPSMSASPRPLIPPQGPIMPPLSPSPQMTPPMSPAQRYSSPMPPQSPSPHRPLSTSSCDSQIRPQSVIQQQLNSPPQQRQQPQSQASFSSIHQALLNGPHRPMTPQSPSSQCSTSSPVPSPTAPQAKPTDTNMIKSLLATKVYNMQMQRIQQTNIPGAPQQPTVVSPPIEITLQLQPNPRQSQPIQPQVINQVRQPNQALPESSAQGPLLKALQGQAYAPRPGIPVPGRGPSPTIYAQSPQYGSYQRNMPQHLGNVQLNQNQSSRKRRNSSPGHAGRLSPKGTRSRSPKGSPKVKSPKNTPPMPSAPFTVSSVSNISPRACQLEVCGDVERAQDVVREDELLHEAKIERIENRCARLDIVENNNSTSQANRNETLENESNPDNAQGAAGPSNMSNINQVPLPGVMPFATHQVPVPVPVNQVPDVQQPLVSHNSCTEGSLSQFPETPAQVSPNLGQQLPLTGIHAGIVSGVTAVVENGPLRCERGVDAGSGKNVGGQENGENGSNSLQLVPEVTGLDNGIGDRDGNMRETADSNVACATDTQLTRDDLNDKDKDKKKKVNGKKNIPAKDYDESPPLRGDSNSNPKLVNGSLSPNSYHKLPPQDISQQGLRKCNLKEEFIEKLDKPVVNGLVNHLGNGGLLKDVEKQLPSVVATALAEDIIKPILRDNDLETLSTKRENHCKSKTVSNDVGLRNGDLIDECLNIEENGKIKLARTNGKSEAIVGSDMVDAVMENAGLASVKDSNGVKNPQVPIGNPHTNACGSGNTGCTETEGNSSNPHSQSLCVNNPHSVASSTDTKDLETKSDSLAVDELSVRSLCSNDVQSEVNSEIGKEEMMDMDTNPPSVSSDSSKPSSLDMVLKDIHDIIEDKSVDEMLCEVDANKTAVEGPVSVPLDEIKMGESTPNTRTQTIVPMMQQPLAKPVSVPYPGAQYQLSQFQASAVVCSPHPQNIPSKSQSSGANKRKDEEKGPKGRKKLRGRASSVESRRSSTQSVVSSVGTDLMCEWANCRKCFENAKEVFPHVYKVHLKPFGAGICQWGLCDGLVRQKFSLCTHVQDRHCTEAALKASLAKRQQAVQEGQSQMSVIPAPPPIYPNDAAIQAIRRFTARPPYQELLEPKEGPVTKHIRLTSALILRNLARYSAAGRSLIKRHENQLAYVSLSSVESSTAIANCLWELHQHH